MRKRFVFLLILLALFFTLFFNRGLFYYMRSLSIMLPYSIYQRHQSPLGHMGISFNFPKDKVSLQGWYPFTLTHFDAEGFSNYSGKKLSLTVLYGFGGFQISKEGSSIYDPTASFYTSFYGGYAVYHEDPQDSFGFLNDGKINTDELQLVPKYDQTQLVLPSLGCAAEDITFINTIDSIEENVSYIGMDGWTRVDSSIITNSLLHKPKNSARGYLQYGKPPKDYNGKDFPLVNLKGRAYIKYMADYQMTFVLYIMGVDDEFIDYWDRALLSEARLVP